ELHRLWHAQGGDGRGGRRARGAARRLGWRDHAGARCLNGLGGTRAMPVAKDLRILVVDDQKSMRELARMCLRGLGIQDIDFVESAEAALERLKEAQFDLIISDWNMEGMSGLEFLKQIRQNPVLARFPFVMATTESTV